MENSTKTTIFVIILVVAITAAGLWLLTRQNPVSNNTDTIVVRSLPASQPVQNIDYEDGIYSASGSYRSPAGNENLQVTVTIAANKIVSANAEGDAVNSTSKLYQSLFEEGISVAAEGKTLQEAALLSHVNGSSLTPEAFRKAITNIETQARV